MKRLLVLFTALAALLPVLPAFAEMQQYGRYEVHYSLFASDFLSPQVARAYGVVRAPDRALLNVAVRRREDSGSTVPVAAAIEATRSDLVHRQPLPFREVREDGAIYYLADFPFRNEETHYLELRIRPEGDTATLELRFNKMLYTD